MAEAVVSKCPHCGAKIEYDGKSEKMTCEYCGCEIGVEEFLNTSKLDDLGGDSSDDFKDPGNEKKFSDEESEGYQVFTCPSCGGQLVTDKNTAATTCVYCGNPAMVGSRLTGMFKPDLILPFKMNKDDAKKALKNLYKGKPLLPSSFKSENRIDSVVGFYIPFWLFGCDTSASMTFKAKRVTSWSDANYIYTKTDNYRLYRSGNMSFNNIPADGSQKTDDTLMESIEPFDNSKAVSFEAAYLAGYSADKYDVEPKDLRGRINARILSSITSEFMKSIMGYTGVIRESSKVNYKNDDVKYALYPIWMLNTTYRGKRYTFAMNGESGASSGNLPVSMKRFFAYLGGFTLGIGAILSLIMLFLR